MSRREYNIATVGDQLEDFLDRVLDAADLDIDFDLYDGEETEAYFEGPTLVVKFEGPDISYLMANKGEALLALEQLTQEVLRMNSDEHAMLCFDANDFRLLRQEELRLSALTVAQRVRESNTPYRFNPMNSRERRVVHLALRGETDLRTESAGVGPGRHVVVYPAGMASLPDLPPQPPQFRGPGAGHGPGFGHGPRDGGGRRPGGPPPRRGRR
jgi:spoIIIJ-associated protein